VSGNLLIGFGNPGRGDDGLGPAFARRMAERQLPELRVEIDYQLTVEHALMISAARTVVFADAALDAETPYYFKPVDETPDGSLDSHTVSPEAALALSRLLFGVAPSGFVLGLRGETFGEMAEGLSLTALSSLDAAEAFFVAWYSRKEIS
jgi:hydrogenase maturation protease